MCIPGFTAGATLYRSSRNSQFSMSPAAAAGIGNIIPQQCRYYYGACVGPDGVMQCETSPGGGIACCSTEGYAPWVADCADGSHPGGCTWCGV
jgi:hypothetical protein